MPELSETLSPLAAAALKARLMDIPHWTAAETALYLGVDLDRINHLVMERKLTRIKGVSRSGLFRRDEVLGFLEQGRAA